MRIRLIVVLSALVVQLAGPVSISVGNSAAAPAPKSVVSWMVGLCSPTRGIALDVAIESSGRTAVIVGDHFLQKVTNIASRPRVTATSTVVGGNEVVLHPDRRFAIVSSVRTGTVSVVDLAGTDIRPTFRVGLKNVRGIALSPEGKYLYAIHSVDSAAHFLRVYAVSSARTLRAIRSVRIPFSPRSIAVSADGDRAAITSRSRVLLVSLHNPTVPVLRPVVATTLREADAVTFTTDGGTVFVADRRQGGGAEVVRVNAFSNAVVSSRQVSSSSTDVSDLEMGPGNTTLWVALKGPLGTRQVRLTTVHVSGSVDHRMNSTLVPTAVDIGPANSPRDFGLVTLRTRRVCTILA